jgi:two-component system CheB/CheR fusion protein
LPERRNSSPDTEFEEFLAYLSASRNFDFTAYKRGSLMRRIHKRMQSVKIASYTDYQDYLEVHPEEFTELFNTILINVTSFFRDTEAWDFLAAEVLPRILAGKRRSVSGAPAAPRARSRTRWR